MSNKWEQLDLEGLDNRLTRIEQRLARLEMPQERTDQTDYEYLREVIIEELNPPDDDCAEVAILADAVRDVRHICGKLLAMLDHAAELARLNKDLNGFLFGTPESGDQHSENEIVTQLRAFVARTNES